MIILTLLYPKLCVSNQTFYALADHVQQTTAVANASHFWEIWVCKAGFS